MIKLYSFSCSTCGETKILSEKAKKVGLDFSYKIVNRPIDILVLANKKNITAPFFSDGKKISKNPEDFIKKVKVEKSDEGEKSEDK